MARRILVLTVFLTAILELNFIQTARTDTKDFAIFDIRKTLPLNNHQPVFRDYYVNIGADHGAKAGDHLRVLRKIPVVDIYRDKPQGDLVVVVADLKIIQTNKSMSVARLDHYSKPGTIPVVQFEKIMLGDRVELVAQGEEVAKK